MNSQKLKYLNEKTILPYIETYASDPSTQEGEAEELLQVWGQFILLSFYWKPYQY